MNATATEYLVADGQDHFTVSLDRASAQAGIVRTYHPTGELALEGLSVAIDAVTASADARVDVTGRIHLHPGDLREDAIEWGVRSDATGERFVQTGTMPDWLDEAVEAGFPSSRCAEYADDASEATPGVLLMGTLDAATLKVGMHWEDDEVCPGFYDVDAVKLTPDSAG